LGGVEISPTELHIECAKVKIFDSGFLYRVFIVNIVNVSKLSYSHSSVKLL